MNNADDPYSRSRKKLDYSDLCEGCGEFSWYCSCPPGCTCKRCWGIQQSNELAKRLEAKLPHPSQIRPRDDSQGELF